MASNGEMLAQKLNFTQNIIYSGGTNNLTISCADQTTGTATLTIPDLANTNQTMFHTGSYLDIQQLPSTIVGQLSTGVISGGAISINDASSALFDISAGTGMVIDASQVATIVSWDDLVGLSTTYTDVLTWVSIDISGSPIYSAIQPTNIETRTKIFLGVLVHVDQLVINAVNNEQLILTHPTNGMRDLFKAVGFINISGNVLSWNGNFLKFAKSEGIMFGFGLNCTTNSSDPHSRTIPAIDTSGNGFFQYRAKNGTSSALTLTDIQTTVLDDGSGNDYGSMSTIEHNKWGAQRVYVFSSGAVKIQFAQYEYLNAADALAAVNSEGFITESSILANGLLIGYIVVEKSAPTLINATFTTAGKFSNSSSNVSGSLTTLQQAYNNSNPNPVILTNATDGEFIIKRGSTADTDKVVCITDGSDKDILCAYGNKVTIASATVPLSDSAVGSVGTIAYDSSFCYICTATNTWGRVALSSF
jgi:hypothetical protein